MSHAPLNLLCIEPRFPGRLGATVDRLVRRRGYRAHFYAHAVDSRDRFPPATGNGMDAVAFGVGGVAQERAVDWRRTLERGICYAYGCWEVLESRRPRPVDVILARSDGLGSSLFANVYLPGVPIVQWFDYYFQPRRNDFAEEIELPGFHHWRRAANAVELVDLENGVIPWTPTEWQRDLFPKEYQSDFHVLYDGIDARRFRPDRPSPRLAGGVSIPADAKVVTFVGKSLGRLRGFDRFLDLAERLIRDDPNVIAIAAGDARVHHAVDVEHHDRDYAAERLSRRPMTDPDRLRLIGATDQETIADLLARSDLHVYPSRAYPASRSLVEAMASGRAVLAHDTAPVREFIEDGRNGFVANFHDSDAAFSLAKRLLNDPAGRRSAGAAARELVLRKYSDDVSLPRLDDFLNRVVADAAGSRSD